MTEQETLLSELNDSQREAVVYCDGPQLVIAGAGSGKTRVLTYKIAWLLLHGLKPWSVLALTFTNKAAREMKERIGRLVGDEQARMLNMGTFHSVFSRILRREAAAIGFQPNFTIYDQSDSRQLVKDIIKEMQLDDKVYKAAAVADRISRAKNVLLLPDAYAASRETVAYDTERRMPMIKDIYKQYSLRCRQANAMDFDDLLIYAYKLFNEHEDIRRNYAGHFAYVLVDEYQDTNFVQQAVVMQLTKERQRVCVVGDDAQSIYAFRGANIDNILNFTQCYDHARLFKLEQNYRSTQRIVEAANSLIKHNRRQIPKTVFSNNEPGDKLQLKETSSDKEEAVVVCRDIKAIMKQDHCSYDDFAILYRTNAQSRSFEEAMRKMEIPYRIYGGLSFYQRKEVKDVLGYIRLVVNPDDEEALRRVINYPARGIGATTLAKISAAAVAAPASLWDVTDAPERYGLKVSKATMNKLSAFRDLIDGWRARLDSDDAYTLAYDIVKNSGIAADITSSRDPESLARQENVDELLTSVKDFVEGRRAEDAEARAGLADYLQEVALMTDLESDDDKDAPKVALMTVHSAKGLEFQTVFVVGLEENIFPSAMSVDNPKELEEERRLLYVAITRARRHCILTCAQYRFRYGKVEMDPPSRFIDDINPDLINKVASVEDESYGRGDESYGRGSWSRGGSWRDDSSWMQNPHPVASQFKADPKPRAVAPRREELPDSPFSESFEKKLKAAGVRTLRPMKAARQTGSTVAPSSATAPSSSSVTSSSGGSMATSGELKEGMRVEHQRFGKGTVMHLEGKGPDRKATIAFDDNGTKQLLLKFARLQISE